MLITGHRVPLAKLLLVTLDGIKLKFKPMIILSIAIVYYLYFSHKTKK